MYSLAEWLNGLLRVENVSAVIGSLKRRMFKLDFLEMRIDLTSQKIPPQISNGVDIKGYSEGMERRYINLLNSVGSLGLWNKSRFQRDILSSVEDIKNDIFAVYENGSAVGFAVLHKNP